MKLQNKPSPTSSTLTVKDISEAFSTVADALKVITNNPEGGELNIKVFGTGQVLRFSMPPLAERHPPTLEDIKKMKENLKGFNP